METVFDVRDHGFAVYFGGWSNSLSVVERWIPSHNEISAFYFRMGSESAEAKTRIHEVLHEIAGGCGIPPHFERHEGIWKQGGHKIELGGISG